MGVVRLQPDPNAGDLTRGYVVERNSIFYSHLLPDSQTRCEFRNNQPVTLWPMDIVSARLTSVPPDLPDFPDDQCHSAQFKGAVRIRLKLRDELTFAELSGLDRLPVYISGNEQIVSHLFELLHCHHLAVVMPSADGESPAHTVTRDALIFEGLEPEHSLLPVNWNMFHGHTLIQEYLCFRQRFYFFTLTGLEAGFKNNHTSEAEIIILLSKLPQELIAHVDASRFLLFCTPVINLFPKRLDRIDIKRSMNSFHAVPDRCHPLIMRFFQSVKLSDYWQKIVKRWCLILFITLAMPIKATMAAIFRCNVNLAKLRRLTINTLPVVRIKAPMFLSLWWIKTKPLQ